MGRDLRSDRDALRPGEKIKTDLNESCTECGGDGGRKSFYDPVESIKAIIMLR